MVENDYLPLWALSIGIVVPLVAVVGVCICGCRKTVPKSDLHGLPGMVKITNPDDNSHQAENETCDSNAVGSSASSVEACDNSRRSSATVNRSLPAIPSDSGRLRSGADALWESEPNGDTGSELYATVGDKRADKQACVPLVASNSRHDERPPSGDAAPEKRMNIDQHAQHEEDDNVHYDCLKSEHPYDRVKKSEHPYAQVKAISDGGHSTVIPGTSSTDECRDAHEDVRGSAAGVVPASSPGHCNPVPPPRARRSTPSAAAAAVDGGGGGCGSSEDDGGGGASLGAAADRAPDIAAATAISGRVAASQELPYMTPPIAASGNFSGDSQDSKGYTSISVREPLATIKAQTKIYGQNHPVHSMEMPDSHYATVSDDSDEMYAAIEDPVHVYNSGSETYAQIQPSGMEVMCTELNTETSLYPPQPPSVDSLKFVAHAHSRQASSSSASSSVANLGSPKPEKRQANSPLPPPPPSGNREKSCTSIVTGDVMNLEDMYAKVMKKKHNSESSTLCSAMLGDAISSSLTSAESHHLLSPHPEQVKRNLDTDSFSVEGSELPCGSKSICFSDEYDKYKGRLQPHSLVCVDSDSEMQNCKETSESQQYFDPGYEVVYPHASADKNTVSEVNQGPSENKSSSSSSDSSAYNNSNYTKAIHSHRNDRNDTNNNNNTGNGYCPKYEPVHSGEFSAETARNNRRYFSDEISEPNYESMPSEETEHNYTGTHGASENSEIDPNYEIVEHDDPNYESVSYIETSHDPPYERLHNEVRDFDRDSDCNYEDSGHCSGLTAVQPDVSVEKGYTDAELDDSEPGYEEIGQRQNKMWRGLESVGDKASSVST